MKWAYPTAAKTDSPHTSFDRTCNAHLNVHKNAGVWAKGGRWGEEGGALGRRPPPAWARSTLEWEWLPLGGMGLCTAALGLPGKSPPQMTGGRRRPGRLQGGLCQPGWCATPSASPAPGLGVMGGPCPWETVAASPAGTCWGAWTIPPAASSTDGGPEVPWTTKCWDAGGPGTWPSQRLSSALCLRGVGSASTRDRPRSRSHHFLLIYLQNVSLF